jgi:ElaB/YqjD/DUF883 family membrane-anchored ribosome-binding protein
MKDEVLEKVGDVGAAAAHLGAAAGRVKEAVADAVEDWSTAAKRGVKHGRRAAEDVVDDTKYQVRQHALGSLGVSFGIGLGVGALLGMLLAPQRRSRQ